MLRIYIKVWRSLGYRRRIEFALLFPLMLGAAVAEMASLGLVIPFLSVLTNPTQAAHSIYGLSAKQLLGISTTSGLVGLTCLVFGSSGLISAALRIANIYYKGRVAASVGIDLASSAYSSVLKRPYLWHVVQNSGDILNALTNFVNRSVMSISALLDLAVATFVSAGLIIGLIVFNWEVTVISIIMFGIIYWTVSKRTMKRIRTTSKAMYVKSNQIARSVNEGLGFARDILIDGSQDFFEKRHALLEREFRIVQADSNYMASYPRYMLEGIALTAFAVIGWSLSKQGNATGVLTTLGTLALCAQRLLPSIQLAYASIATINSTKAEVAGLLELITQKSDSCKKADLKEHVFTKEIRLQNVGFSYRGTNKEILNSVNLKIRHGEKIGLIGASGSGKSTLLDIVMGLLEPTSGFVEIDGYRLGNNIAGLSLNVWQRNITHVPQTVYIADASLIENVALATSKHNIDAERVKSCCKMAGLEEYIMSLEEGYSTFLGERGVKMSGGQRQRLGIARALYKNGNVLVLDEATSALDVETEERILESIKSLPDYMTIIIVSHRISSLRGCDRVYRVDRGAVAIDKEICRGLL